MPRGIETRDVGQERLRSANVARCLLPANVLFARLQCESQRRATLRVGTHSNEASRERTSEDFGGGKERRVGSAVTHGYAESLCAADCDVETERRRRSEQSARQRIGDAYGNCPSCVRRSSDDPYVVVIRDEAARGWS